MPNVKIFTLKVHKIYFFLASIRNIAKRLLQYFLPCFFMEGLLGALLVGQNTLKSHHKMQIDWVSLSPSVYMYVCLSNFSSRMPLLSLDAFSNPKGKTGVARGSPEVSVNIFLQFGNVLVCFCKG